MDREKKRRLSEVGDCRHILRIVRELAVDLRIDRQDRAIGHKKGLAVGWRTDHPIDRDASVRTGAILDHHGLTKTLLEPAANDARQRVWHTSRRVCYDEFDRSIRRLRPCGL